MKRINKVICFCISALVFSFILWKANHAAFTYDEATSFLRYVPMSPLDILIFKNSDTNNHILNTLAMKMSRSLLNDNSELTLRLSNVLIFILYSFSIWEILKHIHNVTLVIPAFSLLIFNPFFLDFFSLARGYGLAVAFVAASVASYLFFIKTRKMRYYACALASGCFAVLANFATLYYFMGLLILHNLMMLIEFSNGFGKKENLIRFLISKNIPTLICLGIFFIVTYESLNVMLHYNISFGGMQGIWKDTAISLIVHSAYEAKEAWVISTMKVAIIAVTTMNLLIWSFHFLFRQSGAVSDQLELFFITGSFFLTIFLSALHHHLTGTPYLINRFAIFLVPLFWLCFVFPLDKFSSKWIGIIPGVLALVMISHTIKQENLDSFYLWKFDACNKRALERLLEERNHTNQAVIQVGFSQELLPSIDYYKVSRGISWLKGTNGSRGFHENDNYRYITFMRVIFSDEIIPSSSCDILEVYPLSQSLLLECNRPH